MKEIQANLQRSFARLPKEVGNIAVRLFKDNIKDGGFFGQQWKPRKEKGRKRKPRRAMLVKSGALRRSIVFNASGMSIAISSDLPYAEAHNEGVDQEVGVRAHSRHRYGKVKEQYVDRKGVSRRRTKKVVAQADAVQVSAHRRHMLLPKRQFIGSHARLEQAVEKAVLNAIDRIIR